MIITKKVFVLLLINVFSESNCEIFSAIEELDKLAVNERLIVEELKIFASQVNDVFVEKKLKTWLDELITVAQDVQRYITNPLNAFCMIKRATSDIKLIEKRFPLESQEFSDKISKLQPSDEDLSGAVEGLLRLQTVYMLKSEHFAKGIIDVRKTRPDLSAHDLFVIGYEAFKLSNQDYFAKEYLNLAWKSIQNGNDVDGEVDEKALMSHLLALYNRSGDYIRAIEIVDKFMESSNASQFETLRKAFVAYQDDYGSSESMESNPFTASYVKNSTYSQWKEEILYGQVCRGDVKKSNQEQAKLRCRFISNNSFTKLARFKVEEVNLEPYIVLIIDALSDQEMQFLKHSSKVKSKRAGIYSATFQSVKSNYRTAKFSKHHDNEHEVFRRISQRVEDMTGLSQETAEKLQVQNYGIGGHYLPHWDCLMKGDKPFETDGNRIATVLFYLSDVEKGGATGFPALKFRIDVRKGAAAFWYNLELNGQGNYLTRHAACPVLIGSKWVANRWIHEHGNEFRRPCIPEKFVETSEEFYLREFF